MAPSVCPVCDKGLDIEPVRCPYCRSAQPSGEAGAARSWLQAGSAAVLSVLLGLAGGWGMGQRRPLEPVPRPVRVERPAVRVVDDSAVRASVRAALEAQRPDRKYRTLQVEDALVDGEVWEGRPVAVAGAAEFLNVPTDPAYFAVATGVRSGGRLSVDPKAMSAETLRKISNTGLSAPLFLVKGVLRRGKGPVFHAGSADYVLSAEDVVVLGQAPRGTDGKGIDPATLGELLK